MEKRETNFQNFEKREQNKEDILQKKQEELENSVIEIFKKEEKEKDFSSKNLEKILDFAQKGNLNLASEKIINFLGNYFQDNIANKEKIDYLLNFSKTFDLPIDKIAESSLKISLSEDMIYRSQKIINFLKENNIQIPLDSIFFESIENKLSQGEINEVKDIFLLAKEKNIQIDFSNEKKEKIAIALENGTKKLLELGNLESLNKLINFSKEKNIPIDFSKKEFYIASKKGIEKIVKDGFVEDIKNFYQFLKEKNIFIDLQEKDIKKSIEDSLISQILKFGDEASYFKDFNEIISFFESKNIHLDLEYIFTVITKNFLLQGKTKAVEKLLFLRDKKNKKINLELDTITKKSFKESLLKGWGYVAQNIIDFIKEKNLNINIEETIQEVADNFCINGKISYLKNLLNLSQENKINVKIEEELILNGIKKIEIRTLRDIIQTIEFINQSKGYISKEIREGLVLGLVKKLPNFIQKERTQVEVELMSLKTSFGNFLNNFLGKEKEINPLFIKLLYESLPSGNLSLIFELREDAQSLNNLDSSLEIIRDLIHNFPSKENLVLIKKINEFFNKKEDKEKIYQEMKEFWFEKYSFLYPDFYSKEKLEKFENDEKIKKIFLKIQEDLEGLWEERKVDKEEISNLIEKLQPDLKEKIEKIIKDNNNLNINISIGNLRHSLYSILISKDTKNKDELYLLDRYLEEIEYKSYGNYLSNLKEIKENNFSESLEVLKSILKSMEADFFVNQEMKEIINVINTFEFKKEDLPKLKFYIESLLDKISNFLEKERKDFYQLYNKFFPGESLKQKEELFSQLFRNKSIQFADDLALKINQYLENNKTVSEQSLKEMEKIKNLRKEEFNY